MQLPTSLGWRWIWSRFGRAEGAPWEGSGNQAEEADRRAGNAAAAARHDWLRVVLASGH